MNWRSKRSQVLLAAIVSFSCAHASAHDTYLARWQELRARQPNAVSLEISAVKSQFYAGELIPLQLSFTSTQPKSFLADTRLQDRVGRMNGVEEFLVDPGALTDDPLRGLPGETGGMGGLSGGPCLLTENPFTFERVLNEWVHFRKPGQYRIAVLSRRVTRADPAKSVLYLQTHPGGDRVEIVSNILTLDIVAASEAWVTQQIDDAVPVLDAPDDPSGRTRRQRLRAGQRLRFLESPEAALALARHLGPGDDIDSWSLHMGVLGSPYRKQLVPLLDARLTAPDQPVWSRYLDTLSRLSELVASGGPMGAYPRDPSLQAAWLKEQRRREEVLEGMRKIHVARLIASLPAKQPQARVISMSTLLDSAGSGGSDAPWLPALAASLIADFRHLPPNMQLQLLEGRWNIIGGPGMLPILHDIYAIPPDSQPAVTGEPRVDPRLRDIAVRRIYELAPDEGRRIILSQLAQPNTYLSLSTLEMLPDRKLPEWNGILASRLERGQFDDSLILRYATGDILKQVEQAYLKRNAEFDRQKLPHCGAPLIYYFLQYDPTFGERELRSEIDKTGAPPVCYDIGFQFRSLDRNAYSPALERLAIGFLTSPKVPVKRGAAEVLGTYGSPAAENPLWDALEYFHSWWRDREEELEQNSQEGMQFERALRIALAQASGWTLREDGLNRLLGLCSSKWCNQEVSEWLSQATSPVTIRILPGSATIAQYKARSDEQMRGKIRQFPAGTVFRVVPSSNSGDIEDVERAEQMVRSAGYALAPQ